MTPNQNDIPLDEGLDNFLKLLNSEFLKFKELLTEQVLYDVGIVW